MYSYQYNRIGIKSGPNALVLVFEPLNNRWIVNVPGMIRAKKTHIKMRSIHQRNLKNKMGTCSVCIETVLLLKSSNLTFNIWCAICSAMAVTWRTTEIELN